MVPWAADVYRGATFETGLLHYLICYRSDDDRDCRQLVIIVVSNRFRSITNHFGHFLKRHITMCRR